jgi:hypothetical protein
LRLHQGAMVPCLQPPSPPRGGVSVNNEIHGRIPEIARKDQSRTKPGRRPPLKVPPPGSCSRAGTSVVRPERDREFCRGLETRPATPPMHKVGAAGK